MMYIHAVVLGNASAPIKQVYQLMSTSWKQELHDTAAWFESWMSGTVPETEESFARLAESMHEDFLLVRDTGQVQNRHQLCDEIRGCHGLRKGRRVWMENEQLRYEDDRTILCTCEEWNDDGHNPHGILSAMTFIKDPDGPNGLRCLHWHETTLPAEVRPCRELSTKPVGRFMCSIPALHTTDIAAAKEWWGGLGFTLYFESDDHLALGRDHAVLNVGTWKREIAHAYLAVRGLDALFDEVRAQGIKIHDELNYQSGDREFTFDDPWGNVVTYGDTSTRDDCD
jgi:hypothetical protein